MRHGWAFLLVAPILLSGCSLQVGGRQSVNRTISGFGTGATSAEAQKNAWDDAWSRAEKQGIEIETMRTTGRSASGVNGSYSCEVDFQIEGTKVE